MRLAKAKLQYDIGASFMSVLTFSAALTGASDKIAGTLGIHPMAVVVAGVPLALLAVWGLGAALDRMRFYEAYQDEINKRNTKLMEALKR